MTKLITQGKINDTISRMVRSAREARKIEANGDEQWRADLKWESANQDKLEAIGLIESLATILLIN